MSLIYRKHRIIDESKKSQPAADLGSLPHRQFTFEVVRRRLYMSRGSRDSVAQ